MYNCTNSYVGRFASIDKSTNALSLCEVKVFGHLSGKTIYSFIFLIIKKIVITLLNKLIQQLKIGQYSQIADSHLWGFVPSSEQRALASTLAVVV